MRIYEELEIMRKKRKRLEREVEDITIALAEAIKKKRELD